MEKKIIHLTKDDSGNSCLTCGATEATVHFKAMRINYPKDNIISFHMCDDCVAQIQKDVHKICE